MLAVFVLFINPRRRLNQIFCALGLTLAWSNIGIYSLAGSIVASQTLFITRFTLMGCIFIPALIYHLAVEMSNPGGKRREVFLIYSVAIGFACLNYTSFFIKGVRPVGDYYVAEGGPAFVVFCWGFFPVIAFGSISVLIAYIHRVPRHSARAAKFLVAAVGLIVVGMLHDALPVMGLDTYPGTHMRVITWGTLGVSIYGLIIAYGILSDQLFDIRVSISRHSATVLRLCFLGGIAYLLLLTAGALSPDTFTQQGLVVSMLVLFVSAAITSQIFPKLFGGVSARVEEGILGDHFEYRDKIAAFIRSPQEPATFQILLDDAAEMVFRQLNLAAVGIAITGGDFRIRGQTIRTTGVEPKWQDLLAADSPLIKFFGTSSAEMIDTRNDFQFAPETRSVSTLLKSASVELAICIGTHSRDPLGVMIFGTKRDGRSLTRLDAELLRSLCRSLEARVERIAILQNEELRQANSAKDRFLASINHEIRNPLNGITGIVQMLSEKESDARSAYLLCTLRACTEQLQSTMDDVLDFTHIESDRVILKIAEVNLNQLVRFTCAGNDPSERRLVLRKAPSPDVLVLCDAGKVRQIISNYLANAIKYGDPPGAEVDLVVNEVGDGKVCASITVSSKGPALCPEELEVLFTALTRGQRARETNAHGTGLGLAHCKRLANAMGGTVGVESADGQNRFWFKTEFPMVSKETLQPLSNGFSYSGCRALAIEDESYNRLVLEHHLERFGVNSTWADDGVAALAAAKTQSFDVIVMDWLLPDMDGAELLHKLREASGGSLPPVIVLSAYSTTSKRAECLAAGAVAFVSKPIDATKLTAAFELCDLHSLKRGDAPVTSIRH